MNKEIVPREDMGYLIQQSNSQINMILAEMMALMNDTDNKVSMIEDQKWFKRMCYTLSGKNKLTKEEIKRNHDRINIYISQAMTEMFELQCIDRQIIMSLGNQLNQLYTENNQLKQMLGAFVNKLNQKIESIDNFHILNIEIDQGVYSNYPPIVSICKILLQIDKRCIQDERKMSILQRTMVSQGILNDVEVSLFDYLMSILEVSTDDIAPIYIELASLRGNFLASIILKLIENYHFIPEMTRKLKDKKSIVENVIISEQLDSNVKLSINYIYDDFVNSKLYVFEDLIPISEMQYDSKLKEAEKLFIEYKLDKAFEIFKTLAENGNPRAMYFMGEYYCFGLGSIKEDKDESYKWRLAGKNAGDVLSALNLSLMLEDSNIESKNTFVNSVDEVLKMAENGDIFAQYEIAYTYENEQFLYWIEKSASDGFWRAQYGIAIYYTQKNDVEEAFKWYKKVADLGNEEAMMEVANRYYSGEGIQKNDKEAFKWYKKAAYLRNEEAVMNVAYYYCNGIGTDVSYKEAFKWYRKASDLGNAEAMIEVAKDYYNGVSGYKSKKEAFKWYKKAADLGNIEAMNCVGNCYYNGEGVLEDYKEAFKWYKKALDLGNKEAVMNVAYCYYNGIGTDVSYKEAFKWYRKAADSGNAEAMIEVAKDYYNGVSGYKSKKEAFKWYKKAADLGNIEAMNCVGNCYYNGEGVLEDYKEAFKWYKKAAEKGSAAGKSNLAICYRLGHGCEKNLKKAKELAANVVAQGVKEVIKF